MRTGAHATVIPSFDFEQFAKEAARMTLVPPCNAAPTWSWLNETSVPVLCVQPGEIPRGEIDHRSAFFLFHIDGVSSLRDIVSTSGIARQDALSIVAGLMDRGFIWLEDAANTNGDLAPRSGIQELSAKDEATLIDESW